MEDLKNVIREALQEVLPGALQKELAPVHERLDRLEGKVDKLEDRFDVLEGKVDKLEDRFDVLESKVDKLEDRFDVLESKVDKLEDRFDVFEGKFVVLEGKVDKLEGKVDKLSAQLDRMEHTQNEDIVAVLHQINKKTTERFERTDSQMRVLNDRLFTVEAEVRKLQQTSE